MRTEWFQRWATPQIESILESALGAEMEIGGVDLDLPAKLVLRQVSLADQQGEELFGAGEVRLSVATFSLLDLIKQPDQPEPIRVRQVDLMGPRAFIYKSRRDSSLNLDFLTQSDSPPSDKPPTPLALEFPSLRIRAGEFAYVDSTAADSVLADTSQINFANLALKQFDGDLSFFMDAEQNLKGEIGHLAVREARSGYAVQEFQTVYDLQQGPEAPGGLDLCLENTIVRASPRMHLDFDAELVNARPDTVDSGFEPGFNVNFRPSSFDFATLNAVLPNPLPMNDPAQLQGEIHGDLQHMESDELLIGIYDSTRLRTAVVIEDALEPNGLKMEYVLSPSLIAFNELNRFLADVVLPLAGRAVIDGAVRMDMQRIKSRALHLRVEDHTELTVRAQLNQYDDEENMVMDFRTKDAKIDFRELLRILPGMDLPPWLAKLGEGRVDGNFVGGTHDFLVRSHLWSPVGEVEGNLHLTTPRGPGDLTYVGDVRTAGLNLDAIGLVPEFQSSRLNFTGEVDGAGTEFGKMAMAVEGKLWDSEIMGYTLDSVRTKDVRIDGWEIKGGVEMQDREGDASLAVDLFLPEGKEQKYILFGDVNRLDLDHYGLLPGDSIFLTSILNVRLNGDSLENYTGALRFFQLHLDRRDADSLVLNNVVLTSSVKENFERRLKLRSSLATFQMDGRFKINDVIQVGSRLAKEIDLYVRNNDTLIAQYYAAKEIVPAGISLTNSLTTKRGLNDLMSFFRVPAFVQPGTQADITLVHDGTDQLYVYLSSDTVRFNNMGFFNNEVDLTLDKREDQNELLLVGRVSSKEVDIGKNLVFMDFSVEPEGNDRQLDLFVKAKQPALGNRYMLDIRTDFLAEGEIQVHLIPESSELDIKGNIWRFGKENRLVRRYEPGPSEGEGGAIIERYQVRDFRFYKGDQEIRIDGYVSDDPSDVLETNITRFPIGEILEITETDLGIDGTVKTALFRGRSLLAEVPNVYGSATLDNFRYQTIDSLDIVASVGWPFMGGPDFAGMSAVVNKEGVGNLDLYGSYQFSVDSLDIAARPSRIPLLWLEPFLAGEVTDLSGVISLDTLTITGTTREPQINGSLHLTGTPFVNSEGKADMTKVGGRVTYLNSAFSFDNDTLIFRNDTLRISRLRINDQFGGSAVLHGTVLYPSLTDILLDLLLDEIKDFTVMDTRRRHSSDFYGHIVLRGDSVRVRGPATNLQVGAMVSTADNTWLDIPLDDYTSANRLDYVTFVAGDVVVEEEKKDEEISGIGMKVTVNATPGARVRMILDEQVGDIIEARGEGAITMEITEQGEFKMSGVYELIEGNYLFTAENIVNKKFVVEPGGRIIFNGDPYNAELDLTAVYHVNADISDLIGGESGRIPVAILMSMTGSLEEPVIRLSIEIDEARQQDVLGLASYFRRIEYDEQELNKQVVSLLLFGRFSGNTAGNANSTATGVTSSISELISNQVNYWISQAFEDANLGVEVNTNEFQDVELGIRTTLFQDRVTIERNGAIISNQNQSLSIGDLSVQIKLLPLNDSTAVSNPNSGQLVLEIFNREDASLNAAANIVRGAGVFYKKDFDRIPDLFKGSGEKKRKRQQDAGE